jgi:hypothetical protein
VVTITGRIIDIINISSNSDINTTIANISNIILLITVFNIMITNIDSIAITN